MADRSKFDRHLIKVPRSTRWQPDRAYKFIYQLISSVPEMILVIRGTGGEKIEWEIETLPQYSTSIKNIVYALYPDAQIKTWGNSTLQTQAAETGDDSEATWWWFALELGSPFIFPLRYIHEAKNMDPLVTVVSALANLKDDEEFLYQLWIQPTDEDLYALGQRIYKKELTEGWGSKIFRYSMLGLASALSGQKYYIPPPKSADQIVMEQELIQVQKMAQQKLSLPLRRVELRFWICHSPVAERRSDLAKKVREGLNNFAGELNRIKWGDVDEDPTMVLTPDEIAALWHLPSEQMQTPGIVWAGSVVAPLPSQLIGKTGGALLGTNSCQGRSHPVRLAYPDRVTHVNLIGRTRVGKSTLLHHMIHQDIAAGKGVAVIDPHGDLVNAILETSIPDSRVKEVVLFDTRDQEYPIGLNLLKTMPGVSLDATASYALAVMRKLFADQWSSGRMESVLDATLRALVTMPEATIQDIPKLLINGKFRRYVLKNVTDPATLDFWYDEYETESPGQQREFARPINHRIRRFYRDPVIRRIVCQRGSLNFRDILDRGQIFLANLGGVADIEAETLGALLISKIQMAAMSRSALTPEQRTPFYLYVDEVQNFIATSLSKVFSEAGKYSLSLTVANQYLKQLEGDTLEALMGNVGTTIIFGVGPNDARALTPFVKPQFSVEDMTNLDRFATVVKMQLSGQTLPAFSMNTPSPLPPAADAKARIERIRDHSRTAYASFAAEIDTELQSRYDHLETEDSNEETEGNYFD